LKPTPIDLRRGEPTPLNVVPMTPPVEATLRILLNSVPYLIGAAVVRQPAVGDAVAATVGRMPWLFDRRLLTLQLPDDSLPANRAVTLDWPVPYQAEWVGVPPRLLISRLVAMDKTVGVLLGTLITREPMQIQAREALDLSCELIAAAVGSESVLTGLASSAPQRPGELIVLPEPAAEAEAETPPDPAEVDQAERDRAIVEQVAKALDELTDARSIGRILRDAMNVITTIDSFSISLFNQNRQEVAYRYKVVGSDPESAAIGRQPVDDGLSAYAARRDRRWHAYVRQIALKTTDGLTSRAVSVLQFPLVAADEVFGIATLQAFGDKEFPDRETRLAARVLDISSDRLAAVRRAGQFQPSSPSPHDAAAAVVLPPAAAAPSSNRGGSAPSDAPAAQATAPSDPPTAAVAPAAVASTAGPMQTTDEVLSGLLRACESIGLPTTFMVGIDPGAGVIRGELVSGSESARELDYALGISGGRFSVPATDRYNAIARACRERRVILSPMLHEIVHPLRTSSAAVALEQIVGGGKSTVVPIVVSNDVVGALVIGPSADEVPFITIERVRVIVDAAAAKLAAIWKANG